jgi:hypothetical protein
MEMLLLLVVLVLAVVFYFKRNLEYLTYIFTPNGVTTHVTYFSKQSVPFIFIDGKRHILNYRKDSLPFKPMNWEYSERRTYRKVKRGEYVRSCFL